MTFKNIGLEKLRIELQRLIAVLDDMLVQLQLAIAKGSIAKKIHTPNQQIKVVIKSDIKTWKTNSNYHKS